MAKARFPFGEFRKTIATKPSIFATSTASLPVLLDEARFPASNAYGLTHVPSLFLIDPSGKVNLTSVGFTKADVESIAGQASAAAKMPMISPFRPGEVIPASKAG
jgi:hypothetical protein